MFWLTEGKGSHECPGYFNQHDFSLEVVTVMMMIRPFHALSDIIVDTNKYEDKSKFLFLLGYGISI